jgi:hypothetical protein
MHQPDLGLNIKIILASPKALSARIAMGRPDIPFVDFFDSCRLIIGWYIK